MYIYYYMPDENDNGAYFIAAEYPCRYSDQCWRIPRIGDWSTED